jgi:hypothetical protein
MIGSFIKKIYPGVDNKSFQQLRIVNLAMINIIKNLFTFTQFAG